MATGDQNDILSRLRAYLPSRWFGSTSDHVPLLVAILNGFAFVLSEIYALYAYAKQQTRIATATGGFLDIISSDFFGSSLPRNPGESDGSFRARIKAALIQKKVTRDGISEVIYALTGNYPTIVEPWRPLDTGAYVSGASPFSPGVSPNYGYNKAGAWGSLICNAQAFITVPAPTSTGGFADVGGYNDSVGGYAVGSQLSYMTLGNWQGGVSPAAIAAAIAATKAEGTVMWFRIQ